MTHALRSSLPDSVRALLSYDENEFGRKEYIEDAVMKIINRESFFCSVGGYVEVNSLPKILQNKYIAEGKRPENTVWFNGFRGAAEEICKKLKSEGYHANAKALHGGASDDLWGTTEEPRLCGYTIELE